MNEEGLAVFVQQRANKEKNLVFLDRRLYGVSEATKRANYKWSLSQLVFPHQLVRPHIG